MRLYIQIYFVFNTYSNHFCSNALQVYRDSLVGRKPYAE